MTCSRIVGAEDGSVGSLYCGCAKSTLPRVARWAVFQFSVHDRRYSAVRCAYIIAHHQAVVLTVPFRLLKAFQKIQAQLVHELEKKFSGKHVIVMAKRRIIGR